MMAEQKKNNPLPDPIERKQNEASHQILNAQDIARHINGMSSLFTVCVICNHIFFRTIQHGKI